jgi:hypothetical protein
MRKPGRDYHTGGITRTPDEDKPKPKDDKDKGKGGDGGGGGYKAKAARRYLEEAETLALQAKALRVALGKHGFRRALNRGLANINQAMHQSDDELMRGYRDRLSSLQQSAEDNDKAAAGQGYANTANAARERANAISEVAANGAGESDLLRAQQMSLRNWNQNQSEIARSYFDTRTSINASLHDLDADTRSARVNNVLQAQADKNQLYTNYYNQRSETLTQLGNVLGQMAADYSAANEQKGSKKTRRRRKRASEASGEAFMDASHEIGRSHKSRPGPVDRLGRWTGAEDFENTMTGPVGGISMGTTTELARPEGASLRRWEA